MNTGTTPAIRLMKAIPSAPPMSRTVQQTPESQNSTLTQEHNRAFVNETLTEQAKAAFKAETLRTLNDRQAQASTNMSEITMNSVAIDAHSSRVISQFRSQIQTTKPISAF